MIARLSLEIDKLDLEGERGVGRNDWRIASWAVGEVRWARERGLGTLVHLKEALIPSSNDLADTDGALEWLTTADGGIKNRAILERAMVVRDNLGAFVAVGASAGLSNVNLESTSSREEALRGSRAKLGPGRLRKGRQHLCARERQPR